MANESKKRAGRSPGYPSIDLESAIEKSLIIKEKEGGGRYFSPYQSIITHWDYSPKGSAGLLTLSSLIKYGLIETKGTGEKRQAKITDLALKIIFFQEHNQTDSDEYYETLKEAALNPSIFKELWEKYDGQIPSDITLKRYLVIDRKPSFQEDAASECIKHFKDTFLFANLEESDIISNNNQDIFQEDAKTIMTPSNITTYPATINITQSQGFEIPIYLPSGKTGAVKIPKLTSDEWEQFIAILNVYKASVIQEAKPESEKSQKTDKQEIN